MKAKKIDITKELADQRNFNNQINTTQIDLWRKYNNHEKILTWIIIIGLIAVYVLLMQTYEPSDSGAWQESCLDGYEEGYYLFQKEVSKEEYDLFVKASERIYWHGGEPFYTKQQCKSPLKKMLVQKEKE